MAIYLISTADVVSMRALANQALWDTATIQRATATTDGGGGTTSTWATVATVACRIAPVGGGESAGTQGERISDESTAVVTLPAGTDVTEADRIVLGAVTYEVTLVRRRLTVEITRRAEVRRMP